MFFRSSLGRPSATPKHWNTTRWAWQTGCVWEKHECARCDGEANGSGCIILPFLWVTAPKPSLRQSSERCFSELIQPSDKRWHTLRINHFIYLYDVSYLFRLSQFARTSESKETVHPLQFFFLLQINMRGWVWDTQQRGKELSLLSCCTWTFTEIPYYDKLVTDERLITASA